MADSNITAMIDLVSQMLKDNQKRDEESVKRETEWRELVDEREQRKKLDRKND